MVSRESVSVDICIATYRRPALLRDLLRSITQQLIPPWVAMRVIVIDNDADRSAERTVEESLGAAGFPYLYDVQEEQNIALTRNKALDHSEGEYALFVDDDEHVSERWVANHLGAADRFGADVVFGPVIPVYSLGTADWIKKGKFFERPRRETGKRMATGGTGNTLVRRAIIEAEPKSRFDAEYGLTGGSDTDMFRRLQEKGALMVWSDDAEVYESVILNRASANWLYRRAYRGGQTYARLHNASASLPRKGRWMAQHTMYLFGAAIIYLFSVPFPKHLRVRSAMKVMSNLGQISTVFTKKYYREYGKQQ